MTPRQVVRSFRLSLREVQEHFDTILAAVPPGPTRVSLQGVLVEQFGLELGVRWEGFIHDLFVAYLLKERRAFWGSKKTSIRQSVTDRFGDAWGRALRMASPPRWTPRTVEALLDPKQKNIVVTSGDHLYERAKALLGSRAIKFSLDPEDRLLLDFAIALRNYLAHRSKASFKELIRVVSSFTPVGLNAELSAPMRQLTTYLRRSSGLGRYPTLPRIRVLYLRMDEIAEKLL